MPPAPEFHTSARVTNAGVAKPVPEGLRTASRRLQSAGCPARTACRRLQSAGRPVIGSFRALIASRWAAILRFGPVPLLDFTITAAIPAILLVTTIGIWGILHMIISVSWRSTDCRCGETGGRNPGTWRSHLEQQVHSVRCRWRPHSTTRSTSRSLAGFCARPSAGHKTCDIFRYCVGRCRRHRPMGGLGLLVGSIAQEWLQNATEKEIARY
jgi:hypothetical protein